MVYYFSLLTITLCIVLFTFNSRINRAMLYLIGFLLPLSIYGINHHLVFFESSAITLAIVNIHCMPIYYLAPPMIYFYVRSTLKDDYRLSKKDLLHFLPALIGLVSVLPYIFKDFDYKLSVAQQFIDNPDSIKSIRTHWFYPNYINVVVRPIQLFSYSIACLLIIWKYSHKKRNYSPVVQKNIIIKWLVSISFIALLISISYLLMTYTFFATTNVKKDIFNQLSVSWFSAFLYAIIPIMIIIFPDILYGIPRATVVKEEKVKVNLLNNEIPNIIVEDPFSAMALEILKHIEKDRPYLNPRFSINDIIQKLAIPKHHVYYCFNNIIQVKFTTLRTNYRIAHAKSLLLSNKVDTITIEGIGFESGFASKSTFFAVFKEVTGLSPYDFIAQHKQETIKATRELI